MSRERFERFEQAVRLLAEAAAELPEGYEIGLVIFAGEVSIDLTDDGGEPVEYYPDRDVHAWEAAIAAAKQNATKGGA